MTAGLKKCPFCAEEILVSAIKCRYCGEILTGPGGEPTVPDPEAESPATGTAFGDGAPGDKTRGKLAFAGLLLGSLALVVSLAIWNSAFVRSFTLATVVAVSALATVAAAELAPPASRWHFRLVAGGVIVILLGTAWYYS